MIVASQVRCDQNTCALNWTLTSSFCSTLSTFFMKPEKSWNWVHWLYATLTGTPPSIDSVMLVALVALVASPPRGVLGLGPLVVRDARRDTPIDRLGDVRGLGGLGRLAATATATSDGV